MTWLDYVVIAVLVVSIAWGAWRGLVHEVFSLTGWIMAFLAGNLFTAPLADLIRIAALFLIAALALQAIALAEVFVAENVGLTATNWLRADLAWLARASRGAGAL